MCLARKNENSLRRVSRAAMAASNGHIYIHLYIYIFNEIPFFFKKEKISISTILSILYLTSPFYIIHPSLLLKYNPAPT